MATLAADTPRAYELGQRNEYPVIAADIIYEGAAVGLVAASGHAQPLTSADRFVGFAEQKVDNSSGAAAAKNVRTHQRGAIQLSVSGAVITDVGQPVYATDDNTFVFSPVGAVFIGFVRRFVSSGVVVVEFNVDGFSDPYETLGYDYELKSGAYTVDIEDVGKVIFVDTTAVITMPAIATGGQVTLVNIGAYGTVQISADPAAADKIAVADLAGTDDKDHINTLATAQRGDYITLTSKGLATGWEVVKQRGTWAQEA